MDKELIKGLFALLVVLACIIYIIVTVVKKVVAAARPDADEGKNNKKEKVKANVKKAKKPVKKTAKQVKKASKPKRYEEDKKRSPVNRINIPKSDNIRFDDEPDDIDDDDRDTVFMKTPKNPTIISLTDCKTNKTYSAPCGDKIVVGRKKGCDILIEGDDMLSKLQCEFQRLQGGIIVVGDLDSTNGTCVNGHEISKKTIVESGDTIEIGDNKYIIKIKTE